MASEESVVELSGSTQFSEEPEISLGEEEAVEQEADRLEEDLAGLEEEEAGGPDQDSGSDPSAYSCGAWKGSDVSQAEIDWLYRSRRIPKEVFCWILGNEREPVPNPGEVVVFTTHFERGFGLPASDFFRRFLDFYELQPHHLPDNAIFYLSSFFSFMEVQCGACILTRRQGSPYSKFSGLESCRCGKRLVSMLGIPVLPTSSTFRNIFPAHPPEPSGSSTPRSAMTKPTGSSDIWRRSTTPPLSAPTTLCALLSRVGFLVLPVEWKWGIQPHNRRHPPPSQNFARISAEVPESYAPGRTHEDDEDPYPFVPETDDDDCTVLEVFDSLSLSYALSVTPVSADRDPQVLEHVTPLDAEVGDPPAPRVRKTPATDAGTSDTPATKRQKILSSGPSRKKIKNEIAVSSGPALKLTRSAPGMRPEAPKDTVKIQDHPRRTSPAKISSSSHTKPPSPAKGADALPPASSSKPPSGPSGKKFSQKVATSTAEQLSVTVKATAVQPTITQALTLHAGRAAIATGEKVSAQLGRIVELKRGEANLGTLQWYVDKWNTSYMTEATLGIGKDM
ncbi:hypothetical protein QYE76_003941 [Lolium multiflorum]|uniref:Transposase (putative) gypsy type domain-containing protein n=1 Tax=Lolium multiflorum TaxID=4521 RepID=A0AAD8W217_LOLMU|nr:hypothetical protein QYE76_003941 [Lolium multiflorum]